MNWKSGLLRIWAVASVFWVIGIVFVAYNNVTVPNAKAAEVAANNTMAFNACVQAEKAKGGSALSCATGVADPSAQSVESDSPSYLPYAFFMVMGPLVPFALLYFVRW